MNPTIKAWILGSPVVLALSVLNLSCAEQALNPDTNQSKDITDIYNTIWTLNKSGYEPLQLIFNAEGFYGYDGCNWFGGRFEAKNDSIFPQEVTQTKRGCQVAVYPVQSLASPFRLRITNNNLRINGPKISLTFKSAVTASLEGSPLIGNWQLTASTDSAFTTIQAKGLVPLLSITENREFTISWYCVAENTFGCDEIHGLFGIGTKSKILFYKTGWKNHAPGLEFVERILDASSYSLRMNGLKQPTLILVNTAHQTRFEFSAVNKGIDAEIGTKN